MMILSLARFSAATVDTSGTRILLLLLIILAVVLIVAGGVIALFSWSRHRKAYNDYLASTPMESERR